MGCVDEMGGMVVILGAVSSDGDAVTLPDWRDFNKAAALGAAGWRNPGGGMGLDGDGFDLDGCRLDVEMGGGWDRTSSG